MALGLPGARQAPAGAAAVAGPVAYALVSHHAASAAHPGLLEAVILIGPVMAFALLVAWRAPARAAWLCLWLVAAAGLVLARDRVFAGSAGCCWRSTWASTPRCASRSHARSRRGPCPWCPGSPHASTARSRRGCSATPAT
ncbi:hypothetical protein HK414_10540 [Ramlibacter terrae]|uniref:Uncharacterized protein n=1 Tax=Ramlibacter terrae TaxID=2732511 RepID=A0ABX6P228_9BURK|nr:hypothetical protein HK414_10540 [Ramlibacter terrae]